MWVTGDKARVELDEGEVVVTLGPRADPDGASHHGGNDSGSRMTRVSAKAWAAFTATTS